MCGGGVAADRGRMAKAKTPLLYPCNRPPSLGRPRPCAQVLPPPYASPHAFPTSYTSPPLDIPMLPYSHAPLHALPAPSPRKQQRCALSMGAQEAGDDRGRGGSRQISPPSRWRASGVGQSLQYGPRNSTPQNQTSARGKALKIQILSSRLGLEVRGLASEAGSPARGSERNMVFSSR